MKRQIASPENLGEQHYMTRSERLEQDKAVNPVLFYSPRNAWGEFSNFSEHTVRVLNPWTGEPYTYLTGEHRYQAMKADNEADHDYVCEVDNPGAAKMRGRQVSLRKGWGNDVDDLCYYVMLETVAHKLRQHTAVQERLYETYARHIYEDSPVDDIWGWRYEQSYTGKNLLGRAWMHVRYLMI
jgi:ribA/ribD-fused uncharacterized protein